MRAIGISDGTPPTACRVRIPCDPCWPGRTHGMTMSRPPPRSSPSRRLVLPSCNRRSHGISAHPPGGAASAPWRGDTLTNQALPGSDNSYSVAPGPVHGDYRPAQRSRGVVLPRPPSLHPLRWSQTTCPRSSLEDSPGSGTAMSVYVLRRHSRLVFLTLSHPDDSELIDDCVRPSVTIDVGCRDWKGSPCMTPERC